MAHSAAVHCSFCQKPAPEVDKIIAGPGVYICDRCVRACVDILEQAPTDPGADEPQLPAWDAMTDEQVLARLPRIAAVSAQVEGGLQRWVGEVRRRGATWATVGEALGMSRQAAWERFAGGGPEAA